MIKRPAVLFWSIGIVIFWEILGAYVQSEGIPLSFAKYYTASWYGISMLISASALSVSTNYVLSYQAGGLSHMIKFSKLTSKYYLISIYAGITVVSVIIVSTILGSTYLIFGSKFGYSNVLPSNIAFIIVTFIFTGLFFTSLSINLTTIAIRTSRKLQPIINFLPLFLGYFFGFVYLYVNLGNLEILSPFTSIGMLSFYGFMGSNPPLVIIPSNINNINAIQNVTPILPLLSLVMWILVLSLTGIIQMRNLYLKPIEEERIA